MSRLMIFYQFESELDGLFGISSLSEYELDGSGVSSLSEYLG